MDLFQAFTTSESNILAQVLYQNQSVVELIGDVIFSNEKCKGEQSVYITSFEDINKRTYKCMQCKACTHVLINLFQIRDHVLVCFFGPTALEKRQRWITKKKNSHL